MPINPSPAVLRAGELLRHLARHPTDSFSVSELAREVGLPRATCDAILQALAVERLVSRREEDLRYELGPGSITIGDAARIANPVLRAAKLEAERLARELGACISVGVRDGDWARVVEVFDFGPYFFALRARVGQTLPLIPPIGAVFVAWDEREIEAWLARAGGELEPAECESYRCELRAVRERRYIVSAIAEKIETLVRDGAGVDPLTREALFREAMHSHYLVTDLEPDAKARIGQISAPVFDQDGRVTACLLLPGPEREISAAELRSVASRLVDAATRATRESGGREPDFPA